MRVTDPDQIAKIESICREAGWTTGEVARMPETAPSARPHKNQGEVAESTSKKATLAPGSSWTIRIPGWHPPSENLWTGKHWSVKARIKKATTEIICRAAIGIPGAVGKRRVWTHLVMEPKQRAPDPENLYKAMLDGLKNSGAIKNDSERWVHAERPTFSRGAERITFITLEEMG